MLQINLLAQNMTVSAHFKMESQITNCSRKASVSWKETQGDTRCDTGEMPTFRSDII